MVKVGVAFPDFISSDKLKKRRSYDAISSQNRNFFPLLVLLLVLILLFVKVFSLQIIEGGRYKSLSNNNRTKTVVIRAPRGAIFDRKGEPLVFNVPGFRKNEKGLPAGRQGKAKLLSQDEAIKEIALGGTDLDFDSFRKYPSGPAFAHVLGYIGQVSEEELKNDRFSGYRGGDFVGKMGIEKYYEDFLRGIDGKQLIEVDNIGKQVRKLGQTDPTPGKNITLNLDAKLQKAAFDAMKNINRGAVVATTPKGEILTLISKPSFDPNLFTLPPKLSATNSAQKEDLPAGRQVEEILFSKERPLLNRAISGVYPPGSTFKLVVAASGLENRLIDENFTVQDNGVISVGAFSFSNWYFTQYGKTEGPVNVVKGIKRSNDVFFYKLAELVGVDKISQMGAKFGLGKTLGIDIQGEADGLLPTSEWKQDTLHEPWFLGDTYHYGIGQGYLLTTPLQVNGWTQAMANGGVLYEPHLLKDQKTKIKSQKFLSDKTVQLIREGMIESCSTGGVAWPLFKFKIKNEKLKIDGKNFKEVPEATSSASFKDYREVSIACKTGTAQHGDINTEPHAWITLFAPAYDPQIIVTVLAEESGEGSNVAAPIAKKILEEWFGR